MAIQHEELPASEIVRLCRQHTLFSWCVQSEVRPLAIARGDGIYFWDFSGNRYIDFNSQLMSVNIGHGDSRVLNAISEQAAKLVFAGPQFATESRARLGYELSKITPGNLNKFLFTLGGSEANENAIRIARMHTGRQKILSRYRSYHGATAGSITLTGDRRRWANEPGIPGVVHILDPDRLNGPVPASQCLAELEEIIIREGPSMIAAFILETIPGSNGILIPPEGYLRGVRDICSKYGILLICDEVMCGFGRTGRWFAVEHWDIEPDIMTMAKGLTSSYVPLGAVAISDEISEAIDNEMFWGGLTYSSHPIACAAAVANLAVYKEDDLIGNASRMGAVMNRHLNRLMDRHPSIAAVRSIGLFGLIELFHCQGLSNVAAPKKEAIAELDNRLRGGGLYTLFAENRMFTNPPLCINEIQLDEAFSIIDAALDSTDRTLAAK
jgi:taurine--2-oxoglutarate transaminase